MTRDPASTRIDFKIDRFRKILAHSGFEPIFFDRDGEDDLDCYVPMLITAYRYAIAAGQLIDLAAEAINRE